MLYRVSGALKLGTTWASVRGRTVGTYGGYVPWYEYGTGVGYGGTVWEYGMGVRYGGTV